MGLLRNFIRNGQGSAGLIRSAGIYTIANGLYNGIPFLLLPLLTRYLSPSDYGTIAMFTVLVNLASPFTGLSLQGAIGRQYYERDTIDLPAYIYNCLLLLALTSFLVGAVIALGSNLVAAASHFPVSWLWTVVLVATGQFLVLIRLVLWQMEGQPHKYGLLQVTQSVVTVTLSFLLVIILRYDWRGVIITQLVVAVFFAIVSLGLLYRDGMIKGQVNRAYCVHALKFGVPLIPHALGAFLIAMSDRLFIVHYIGIAETGLFDVGSQFGMLLRLLAVSFNQAWAPWLYQKLKDQDSQVRISIVKTTYLYFACILLVAALVGWSSPWILGIVVGEQFVGAGKFVFWTALAYAFNGMYFMVANYLFYGEKTNVLAWITVTASLSNLAFCYVFIHLNGAVGVAQATALSFLIMFILSWAASAKIYKMPWLLQKGL